jgi:hypothetical protein
MMQKTMTQETMDEVIQFLLDNPCVFNVKGAVHCIHELIGLNEVDGLERFEGTYDTFTKKLCSKKEDGLRLLVPDGTRSSNWCHIDVSLSPERYLVRQDLTKMQQGLTDSIAALQRFDKEAKADHVILKGRRYFDFTTQEFTTNLPAIRHVA